MEGTAERMGKLMNDINLKRIELERKATADRLEDLKQRENKALRELQQMKELVDESHLSQDAKEADINFVLGQSEGFVQGFDSAINTVVEMLASQYRNIPMTEDELMMLVELGDALRMAKLKDAKSKRIAEKSGGERNWQGFFGVWRKKEENEQINP